MAFIRRSLCHCFGIVLLACAGSGARPEGVRSSRSSVNRDTEDISSRGLAVLDSLDSLATFGDAKDVLFDHCQTSFAPAVCESAISPLWQGQSSTALFSSASPEFRRRLELFLAASERSVVKATSGDTQFDKCPGGKEVGDPSADDAFTEDQMMQFLHTAGVPPPEVTDEMGDDSPEEETDEMGDALVDDTVRKPRPPPIDGWYFLYAGSKGASECDHGATPRNFKTCQIVANKIWSEKNWIWTTISRNDEANRTRYPFGCSMKGRYLYFNKYKESKNNLVKTRLVCTFDLKPDSITGRDLVNQKRKDTNVTLRNLKLSSQLSAAAWAHALDMGRRHYFSHEAPAPAPFGPDPWHRAWYFGFIGWPGWENIASGYDGHESAMNAWMKSTGHRANILNSGHQFFGYAWFNACLYDDESTSKKIFVQLFGRLR